MTRYLEMSWDSVVSYSWLFAAVLAVILLILLWWAAEREASQYLTRLPGEDE